MISNGEKYIKQKLEQLEVPFDPSNWEKTAHLLDQRKSRKKKPIILGWIMLAMSITAIAWFMTPSSSSVPVAEKETITQQQNAGKTEKISQEKTNTPVLMQGSEKAVEEPTRSYTSIPSGDFSISSQTGNSRILAENAPAENTEVLPGFISHEVLPAVQPENPPVENPPAATVPATEEGQDQNTVASSLSPAKAEETTPSKENAISPPLAEATPAPETVKQAENKTEKKDAQKKNVQHVSRDLVIGLAGGASFNRKIDKTVSDNFAVSPMFGIYADKQLGFRGRLQLRVAYNSIGADKSVSKSFNGKNYGFGSVQDSVVISAKRLNYMHGSLLYGYQLTENIRLQGGAGVAYVFDAVSTYTAYRRENESSTTTSATTNAYGYMNGLNQWTYSLQLGAEYQSKRGLRYGVLFENGLNPLVKENYYGGLQARAMFNFNVYLGYDLAKIKSK